MQKKKKFDIGVTGLQMCNRRQIRAKECDKIIFPKRQKDVMIRWMVYNLIHSVNSSSKLEEHEKLDNKYQFSPSEIIALHRGYSLIIAI